VADGDVSLRYRLLGHDDASPAFNKAARSAEALHGTMSKVGTVLAGVAAGGVLALGAAMVQGVKDAESYQSLQLKSAAVLKSTGNVAGTSVKQIDALASTLETMSGVDEELIINSQNVLATFTKVRNEAGKGNDIFTQGTKAALNLSTALGTDLQASTIQVGKALNDPIKGVTALQRVGVSFTATQKDQIAAMVKSGDTMGAQKLILGELSTEFGGAAKAAGGGFSGAIARLKDVFGDAFRDLAIKYLPDLTRLADWMAKNAPAAIAKAEQAFAQIQKAVKTASDVIVPLFNFIREHSTIFASVAVGIGTVVAAIKVWQAVTKAFALVQAALNLILSLNPIGLVIIAIAGLTAGLIYAYNHSKTFRDVVNAVWASVKGFVIGAIDKIKGAYTTLVTAGGKVITWFQQLPGKIAGFLKSLPGRMLEIGKQAMVGLGKGIADNASLALNPAAAIGGKIGDVISGALGIHSPSRVTMKIGENVIRGLLEGLKQEAPTVFTFLSNFAKRIGDMKVTAGIRDDIKLTASPFIEALRNMGAALPGLTDKIKDQQQAYDDLVKARDDYAKQLSQGINGGGSIAGIGLAKDEVDSDGNVTKKADVVGEFVKSLQAKSDAITKFGNDVNGLRAEGLSAAVIQQIEQAGLETGGALASALATATPEAVRSINACPIRSRPSRTRWASSGPGRCTSPGSTPRRACSKG
jgi:hypothetical protein